MEGSNIMLTVKIAIFIVTMKRYLSKVLLWERRSHSISYVGTPLTCVPTTAYNDNSLFYCVLFGDISKRNSKPCGHIWEADIAGKRTYEIVDIMSSILVHLGPLRHPREADI